MVLGVVLGVVLVVMVVGLVRRGSRRRRKKDEGKKLGALEPLEAPPLPPFAPPPSTAELLGPARRLHMATEASDSLGRLCTTCSSWPESDTS